MSVMKPRPLMCAQSYLYIFELTVHSKITLHNIYDTPFGMYIPIKLFMYVDIYIYMHLYVIWLCRQPHSYEYKLGYKSLFYKRSNHEESFRAVKLNHKNLVK